MDIQDEKLGRFVEAVNSDVDGQIEKILQDAEVTKQDIIEAANTSSLEDAYERIQNSIKLTAAKNEKLVAKKQFESQRDILQHREELIAKIFDNIRLSIVSFVASDKYTDYLLNLLKGEDLEGAVIMLKEKDLGLKDKFAEKYSGLEFDVSRDIKLGGLCLYYPEKGMVLNKSLDQSFNEQRKQFNNKYGAGFRA